MIFKNVNGQQQGRYMARIRQYSLLASALFLAGFAHAQVAIQSLTAASQGGAEVIRIQTSEPLTQLPAGFSIQSPARISLDFAGATNATGSNLIELNRGNLRSANVVEAGGRTRVVLNLNQSVAYETRIDGNALLVLLQAPAAAAPVAGGVLGAAFAEATTTRVQALSDIDFRRGPDNTGRIVVDLANNQTGVDIRQQGRNLVVEFLQTSLPEGLRRRLDVTDFGTPVQTITATQTGDRVRLVVEPTGNWEHSAFQTDNQFVLEVRQVKTDPNRLTQGPTYTGEKISLNFQQIPVRQVLQSIAEFTEFNIVMSDRVTGDMTLRLRDIPWDQALDVILEAKDLDKRVVGNVIWIDDRKHMSDREIARLEAVQNIQSREAVRTQSFRLNFARAEEVATQLTTTVGSGDAEVRVLTRQGSVFAEPRTNQLFVTDIPSKLEEIQGLIQQLDIPMRQVLIEARIVEASERFGRELGVRLGGRVGTQANPMSLARINGNRVNSSLAFGSVGATSAGVNSAVSNIPALVAGGPSSIYTLSLFSPAATRLLNLEIAASQADGSTNVIASPRVVTADQREATIEDGQRIPIQSGRDSNGNPEFTLESASLRLVVTPQNTPDGDVIMKIDARNDSPTQAPDGQNAIETKSVSTEVLVQNGGTLLIGGIFLRREDNDVRKVPGLGDIPVVGNLFRSRVNSSTQRELLIFITPRVLSDSTSTPPFR